MNLCRRLFALSFVLSIIPSFLVAQRSFDTKDRYSKHEYMVPMRDGVNLYTAVYVPKDTLNYHAVMFNRTPYSAQPYGTDNYRRVLGPSPLFDQEGYIFVFQDIRGKFMSEGTYQYHSPIVVNKRTGKDVDHSTDTYDTIEWLLKNIPRNNGRVGIWGISYPGFLAALSLVNAHPALKAVSPQAPMGDTFIGDDFHHNGAFFLAHAFGWLSGTAPSRSNRQVAAGAPPPRFEYATPDGYRFFLELGSVANAEKKYFMGDVPVWTEFMDHGTYDEYWKSRNVPQHMKKVTPAVMTTVGWFDSEDHWGGVNIYGAIEKQNRGVQNIIVWGPWIHGGWARMDGDTLGYAHFGAKTSLWYRENVELKFFNYYLKGKGSMDLPEALAYLTGANEWRSYSAWPPKEASGKNLYLRAGGKLSFSRPPEQGDSQFDEFASDPMKPVPFTAETTTSMGHLFMVEDQRFAASRPDVLVYESDVLTEDVTFVGKGEVNLFASTSGTDCDWIVKLIDILPPDTPDRSPNPAGVRMGDFQMLIGAEVMRSKFRNSFEKPEPMKPNEVTKVLFNIPDKHHRFKRGHRIMIQIQSSWFPLVDRNPGRFIDIYNAKDSDFQKTTQKVFRSGKNASFVKLLVLE